jgi:hypothetical protein
MGVGVCFGNGCNREKAKLFSGTAKRVYRLA